ncbi:MAG TPA: LysE family transporter [Candidatus Acidoferrales bacterium]|nr:LysE family transporter [Candidatus Acidoferrales bacterium]
MNTFLFLFLTYVLGFLTAIPIGATQIEIAKRALNNHLRSAYMVATGSVSSDLMYGAIALFGVAPFLENKIVVAIFGLAATVILWLLAFFTFRDSRSTNMLELAHATLKSNRIAFVTGFSLAVTNPMMIVWWLIGAKIIKDVGLVSRFDVDASLMFLIAGAFGLASYLFTLTNILHWAKNFISNEVMKKVDYALGVVLVLLSFYFLVTSLHTLLNR